MKIIALTSAQGRLALGGRRDAEGMVQLWSLTVVGWA
jgi:hypothetical protein